jgi:hypothetical protein
MMKLPCAGAGCGPESGATDARTFVDPHTTRRPDDVDRTVDKVGTR